MITNIPTSWREDMRTNFAHGTNFYINPRGRVFPALTSTGISYIENDKTTNMRGTYRMQTGATTDLTYLYTLPQRFIIEGWFKPKWAYDVATDQVIFSAENALQCSIKYEADTDTIDVYLNGSLRASTPAYTSNGELQRWIYIRLICDVDSSYYQLYIYQNGTEIKNTNGPVTTSIIALNEISFFPATPAESSYWIIHELDELIATGEYKTYQADRQIIFDFNGTTLGRERIRIPRVNDANDQRGVKSYSLSKSVENLMTGNAGANTGRLTLLNHTGSFSDDQYDAFDPFNGYYNGPQKYLQNRVAVEIESVSPENIVRNGALAWYLSGDLPDIPDTASGITYKSNWLTGVDGWSCAKATLAVSGGELVATVTSNGTVAIVKPGIPSATSRTIRVMYKSAKAGTVEIYGTVGGVIDTLIGTFTYSVANAWQPLDCYVSGSLTFMYTSQSSMIAGDIIRLRFAYVGTGEYDYPLIDGSGNANHAKVYRALPIQDTLGQMLRFNGINAYAQIPSTSELAKQFAKVGGIIGASFWVRPLNATPFSFIIGSPDVTNGNRFYVNIQHGTTLQFKIFDMTLALNIACATNELAHITVVRSGVDGKGYAWKNGVPLTPIQHLAAVASVSIDVYIGRLTAGNYSGGNFDLFGLRFFDFLPTDAQAAEMYRLSSDFGIISGIEPMFIGRTTPGAFRRDSQNIYDGTVTIDIEDGVSELGETTMMQSTSYEAHDICDPVSETDSLVHDITRLVTKKEMRNFALNSSIENATIANSWTNSGMATFERSNTYAQFGTYSMKCIANTIGDKVTQVVSFEGVELLDVGDVLNASIFIKQDTSSAVKIMIEELDTSDTLLGTASETFCGTDTGVFTRVNVSRKIEYATCTKLRFTIYAVATSTFYADGFMLTRGIDPLDYFINNTNDGTSGEGSADSYGSSTYDSVAIQATAVDLEHPYAVVERGSTVWDELKQIGDASIATYMGMKEDGVLLFENRYAETNPAIIGEIEDSGAMATSLDVNTINSVKVHGVLIKGTSSSTQAVKSIWSAKSSGIFVNDEGGMMKHPIANGALLTVSGASEIEAVYREDL